MCTPPHYAKQKQILTLSKQVVEKFTVIEVAFRILLSGDNMEHLNCTIKNVSIRAENTEAELFKKKTNRQPVLPLRVVLISECSTQPLKTTEAVVIQCISRP